MKKVTSEGALLGTLSGFDFSFPTGMYVADWGDNSRIQKFGYLPTPATKTTWGSVKADYRK